MSSENFERTKENVASFVADYKNRISRKLKSAQTSPDECERLLGETERGVEAAYRQVSLFREIIALRTSCINNECDCLWLVGW